MINKDTYVYIMTSASGTLYLGVTNNLIRRVAEHREGRTKGYSKKYGCNKLVYYEYYSNIISAIGREKEIKKWRRENSINQYIKSTLE